MHLVMDLITWFKEIPTGIDGTPLPQERIDTLEEILLERYGKDVIIASGKFEISAFEELFHVHLPSENNMVTIGGWLIEQMGTIPKSGAKYIWKNFLFHILAADPNRVRRVYIRKL